MPDAVTTEVHRFMQAVKRRNPHEREFHQAVQEVVESVAPFILEHKKYSDARILERMTEPDRIVIFRVTWEDDNGGVHANRAWRVQFNNAIGPYKGGMRFHPSVTLSVLKFLGFEQVFKNSLTGLPMGGAKGGSNFDPKGRSDREVMRFCQSLMIELHRHIGDNIDVPAGDIGVGGREVSYMFGQYKRMKNVWAGILTGKSLSYGGSLIRKEATGYGAVYFMEDMLATRGDGLKNKRCLVSGSGNVALYTIEKLNELGAKTICASHSGGFIHDPHGIGPEKLEWLKELKEERRGRLSEYAERFGCEYHEGKRPWSIPCDLAFPSATQNEISPDDAQDLVSNGLIGVSEGANMPTTIEGVRTFQDAKVLYGPGKAANAGGVAVSGLEQSQNAQRITWTEEEVDQRLRGIMQRIHRRCVHYGTENGGYVNYVKGANLGGFVKVADAMLAQGLV
jgi:glutamate dehydrogenase (NADP+)